MDSFITSVLVYTIVMTMFHIFKDVILSGRNITPKMKDKLNKRWLISYVVGVIFLYILYA